jgi:hypothetical protein
MQKTHIIVVNIFVFMALIVCLYKDLTYKTQKKEDKALK